MINAYNSPICRDLRDCFAKQVYRKQKRCMILVDTYQGDYDCPFCKERKEDVHKSTNSRSTEHGARDK